MRLYQPVSLLLLLSQLPAQCPPLSLSWVPATAAPFETAVLHATGQAGSIAVIGFDETGGPTFIPGIGDVLLGFTPAFASIPVFMDASGQFDFSVIAPCKQNVPAFFTQAVTVAPNGFCLSNPAILQLQFLGSCNPVACNSPTTIHSNFNGTPVAGGNFLWFNAVVSVGHVPASGAMVAFRNGSVTFANGGSSYSLPLPNALISFDPGIITATTSFSAVRNQIETNVPASWDGNVFLSGLPFQLPANLAGGTNPVSWTGEFVSLQSGLTFQWKWAAAAYTAFSGDFNSLCVKPVDGSAQNPYANSDHAGTPECFKLFVIGGARGGGGSNWTGSYSATGNVACN